MSRNIGRFPEDFMFMLSQSEFANLKSQIVTSSWGGRRKRPLVFTEHGTVMLASVLRSKNAIEVSINVVNAFIRLRKIAASQTNILQQITEIRSFILKQTNKTDQEFKKVWKVIDELSRLNSSKPKEAIGFEVDL